MSAVNTHNNTAPNNSINRNTIDNNTIPAPLWRRLAAILYDSLLVVAILFFAGFLNLGIQLYIYGEEALKAITESGESIGGIFFYLSLFVITFSFFSYCWTRRGQTLGMQAWHLNIQSKDNTPVSIRQCLIRFVVALPAIGLCGLGVLWCVIDKKKRTWQDILSGSNTLYCKKQS